LVKITERWFCLAKITCSVCSWAAISLKIGGEISLIIEEEIKGLNRMDVKNTVTIDLNDGHLEDIKLGMAGFLDCLGMVSGES